MVVLPVLFLVGSLFLCGHVEAQSSTIVMLKQAAFQWKGNLTCNRWDCNCAFNQQRSCCCGAKDLYQVEDDTFSRIMYLWQNITTLSSRLQSLTACTKVAFKASIDPTLLSTVTSTQSCFGPFNTDVPIPFASIALNDGKGYNPSLGVFTAPCAGVYVFSFTVYSFVKVNERLSHQVQLTWNGKPVASVWEHNREDGEDSASQVVVLQLQKGDQVYLALISGRKLCNYLEHNVFTGFILYPSIDK